MGWRTFFSAGKKLRVTNKVARLLAAAIPNSFGHCENSGRKRSVTASVSKPARNWALPQRERRGADTLKLRFPEASQTPLIQSQYFESHARLAAEYVRGFMRLNLISENTK
jgi:hypothetical protein